MHQGHLLRRHTGRGRAILVAVMKGSGFRYGFIGKEAPVFGIGLEGIVGGLVRAYKKEWALRVPLRQPVYCLVGQDVGNISALGDRFAHLRQFRVQVLPLPRQDAPEIVSGRVALAAVPEMPLAHKCGLVTCIVQQHSYGRLLRLVNDIVERLDSGYVVVFPGMNRRPRRRADGICAETAVQPQPFGGDSIEVWRPV